MLIVPLTIMLTNAWFLKNCSLIEGLGFFVLLPVVSTIVSSCMAFFCVVLCRFPRTLFFLLIGASLVYAATVGYFTPAVFSYNFFYGFFPGFLYDESLSVTWTLVAFRAFTLVVAALFYWMASLIVALPHPELRAGSAVAALTQSIRRPKQKVAAGTGVLVLAAVYFYRGPLGFESPDYFIRQQLGGRYDTQHFSIFYPQGSYSEDEIRWVGAEHEFRLDQVLDAFTLPSHPKIESYIYPSNESKQRFIGAGATSIAKPWSGQIHIARETLGETLKHELVHVAAAPFGVPVIRTSLSIGLVEGLAMALEWDWGNRTLHQYAAGMYRFGILPDIKKMMTLRGFAERPPSVSYVTAGSFCRFLIDRYGIRKFMQVYRSGNYDFQYGRSLEELTAEWLRYLERIPVGQRESDAIDVFFRRPSIFQKPCPRVLAARNEAARKKLTEKDYASAARLYMESYVEGGSPEALRGYLTSELGQNQYSALIAVLDTIILRQQNPNQYLHLFLPIGDACWGMGRFDKAEELYSRVEIAELSESLTEAAIIRSCALRDPAIRNPMFAWVISDTSAAAQAAALDSVIRTHPLSWVPRYLRGTLAYRLKRFEESLGILSQLELTDVRLEAIRLNTMGKCLHRLRRFQEAKSAFWVSLNSVGTEAAVNEANEWVDRCEWFEHHGAP
jgi:tetratricopeptide (TPR) repeat protein